MEKKELKPNDRNDIICLLAAANETRKMLWVIAGASVGWIMAFCVIGLIGKKDCAMAIQRVLNRE